MTSYMTVGPVMICFLYFRKEDDGRDLFKVARDILGATEPSKSEKGTLRSLTNSSFEESWKVISGPVAIRNIAHISDSEEEAYREATFFFGKKLTDIFFLDFLKRKALKENDELWRLARSVGK